MILPKESGRKCRVKLRGVNKVHFQAAFFRWGEVGLARAHCVRHRSPGIPVSLRDTIPADF